MGELLKWVIDELSSLLTYPVGEDMAKCILMIESNRDLEDYLASFLDISNPAHLKFMRDLMQKKMAATPQGYKKTQLEDYIQGKTNDKKKKGNRNRDPAKKEDQQDESIPDSKESKKKPKFVNIFSSDRQEVVLLKGRHICNCQANKHGLVNNCLKCGRIVCEQEGAGPCLFCNNMVRSRNDDIPNLVPDAAVELKDRLLEFDKSSVQRTKVIDDESDYFSTNSVWLSKEQKEQLKKKEEELQNLKHSRAKSRLLVDFTGRYIVQDDLTNMANVEQSMIDEIADLLNSSSGTKECYDLDPNSTTDLQPIYSRNETAKGTKWHNDIGRVQDKQVMEMSDSGMCLSMHQPWATLLISGIKIHEGRSWYTSHRGRLWIASTAKIPKPEDIEPVLEMYRALKGDDVRLPKKFPPGVLLGCVTVSNCLAQEDYREMYPDGESSEPFVFICEDPVACPVMFPMKGQHKIYKLESKIHQAAVKCIQKLSKVK